MFVPPRIVPLQAGVFQHLLAGIHQGARGHANADYVLRYTPRRPEIISTEPRMSAPASPQPNDAHAKALAINLESSIYGTFAEIGAGQEVARWFLSVGAASGTVAQATSAYDKTVSDDIYGAGTRYVSKERLAAMLDHEFQVLVNRLDHERGATTRFFVFADTVATRNYQGTNEQHGWLGLRFQATAKSEPNQILLHIHLKDSTAQLQQEAIGILGVNLVFAAYHHRGSAEEFLTSLLEELSLERLEIDVIELSGPVFAGVDARLWCLYLLRNSLSHAFVFDSAAQIVEPATPLRKRPILLHFPRNADSPVSAAVPFDTACQQFLAECKPCDHDPVAILVLPKRNYEDPGFDNAALLARIQELASIATVVVTDHTEGYQAVDYFRRYTSAPIRMIFWISDLLQIMKERVYSSQPGATMEGLGRMLFTDVTIYVAPMSKQAFAAALGGQPEGLLPQAAANPVVTLDDFLPQSPTDHLFHYLRATGRILPLQKTEPKVAAGQTTGN
jgi:hypothetical protein